MTENAMTSQEVAERVLYVRDWLVVFTDIFSLADLKKAAIDGEFEFRLLTSQTVEEYANELIEGAGDVLAIFPKIQACERCDFQTKMVFEKIFMELAGPVRHAKWQVKFNSQTMCRMAMQTILTTAQKLRESYADVLFDIAAAIRVRGDDPEASQEKGLSGPASKASQPADSSPDSVDIEIASEVGGDVWSDVMKKQDWELHYQKNMKGNRCHWKTIKKYVRFEQITRHTARIHKDDLDTTW